MPRRSTKGPLEMMTDDIPSGSTTQTQPAPVDPLGSHESSSLLPLASTPAHNVPNTQSSTPFLRPYLDLTPLLRPSLYHSIPPPNLPTSLDNPPSYQQQPHPDTPLTTLLQTSHFRLAAEKAATDLCSPTANPADIQVVLNLFYTRLSCLILLSHVSLAATESRALLDILNSVSSAPGSRAGSLERGGGGGGSRPPTLPSGLVPWHLRLVLERLKVVLSGDARRGVMNLYFLASECRAQATAAGRAGDESGKSMWGERLKDVGLQVVSALLEMGEPETAARTLASLDVTSDPSQRSNSEMVVRRTLLWLRLGDLDAAESCFSSLTSSVEESEENGPTSKDILKPLILITQGVYDEAVTLLSDLHTQFPDNELLTHNLAIALVYAGDAARGARLLEKLVSGVQSTPSEGLGAADGVLSDIGEEEEKKKKGQGDQQRENTVFTALLFNLATIYELRTERARDAKMGLIDRVAAAAATVGNEDGEGGSGGGGFSVYERQAVDFKL